MIAKERVERVRAYGRCLILPIGACLCLSTEYAWSNLLRQILFGRRLSDTDAEQYRTVQNSSRHRT